MMHLAEPLRHLCSRVLVGAGDTNGGRGPGRGEKPAEQPRDALRGLRVLIVEDEAVISLELEDLLQGLGCEVVGVAQDAAEAVRMAGTAEPDFLTMDVNLPGAGDGLTAAREIYERYGLRSLFISAFGDAETVARAEAAHPLGWLSKPVTTRKLAETLQSALTGRPDT